MFHPDPARTLSANLYDIYHCCVYRGETPDDRQRNCTKHVHSHSKNKFEKSVHLVGFHYKKFIMMHGHMNVKFYTSLKRRKKIAKPQLQVTVLYLRLQY